MKAKIYIDKGEPFVSEWPQTLTDGSIVWDLHFRNGDVINCRNEKSADEALDQIASALATATGEKPLVF